MGLIPILAALIAGALIGGAVEARRAASRRRRFNAIVEGTETRDGACLYRGVYYEVPDDDAPLPEGEPPAT